MGTQQAQLKEEMLIIKGGRDRFGNFLLFISVAAFRALKLFYTPMLEKSLNC